MPLLILIVDNKHFSFIVTGKRYYLNRTTKTKTNKKKNANSIYAILSSTYIVTSACACPHAIT